MESYEKIYFAADERRLTQIKYFIEARSALQRLLRSLPVFLKIITPICVHPRSSAANHFCLSGER
jgi:hypothetical protein